MKTPIKVLFTLVFIGALLLVGLIFLGKKNEITLGLRQQRAGTENEAGTPGGTSSGLIPKEQNFSDLFAKKFSEELIEQNKIGPRMIDNKESLTLNIRELVEDMVQDSLEIYRKELPVISEADFRVVSHTVEAEKLYLEGVRDIMNEAFGGFPRKDIMEMYETALLSNNYQELNEFATTTAIAFERAKKLNVPAGWAKNHKKSLELLAQSQLLVKGLVAWEEDPLRTLIWLRAYPKLVEESQELLNFYARNFERVGI